MPLAVMKPFELSPDHWISSIWIWSVVLQCHTPALDGPLVPNHTNFRLQLAESFAIYQQIWWAKTDAIGSHETIWVAFWPLHIINVDLIGGVAMSYLLLMAHWCQTMPIFYCSWLKVLQFTSKSEPKLMPLAVMKPFELPSDHWISSMWIWYVVLQCHTGSWWPIGAKPCQFCTAAGWKFRNLRANLSQNWCHWRSWNHLSCLLTIAYHQYESDKWCCNVMLAPVIPLVPNHANFGLQPGVKICNLPANLS